MNAPELLPDSARVFAGNAAANIVDALITRSFTDTVRGCGPTCVIPDEPLTPRHLTLCPCPHEGGTYLEPSMWSDRVAVHCSDCGERRRDATADEIQNAGEAQYEARCGSGYTFDSRGEHDETL